VTADHHVRLLGHGPGPALVRLLGHVGGVLGGDGPPRGPAHPPGNGARHEEREVAGQVADRARTYDPAQPLIVGVEGAELVPVQEEDGHLDAVDGQKLYKHQGIVYVARQYIAQLRRLQKDFVLKDNMDDAITIKQIIDKYDGLEYTDQLASRYISEAKSALEVFPPSPTRESLLEISDYVITRRI